MRSLWFITIVLTISMATNAAIFEDDFESDTAGSFPNKWINFNANADAIVVDNAIDTGTIYDGTQSARITFNGGYGSGIQTTFNPIKKGTLTFYCNIDWASDDLQLMGLHNSVDIEAFGNQLIVVSAAPNIEDWEYTVGGTFTGVPVIFDEYVKFDLDFDTELSVATLFINNEITNIVDFALAYPSTGVTTLCSKDDTGAGTAQWYLDNISVTPEPASILLFALSGLVLRMKKQVRNF